MNRPHARLFQSGRRGRHTSATADRSPVRALVAALVVAALVSATAVTADVVRLPVGAAAAAVSPSPTGTLEASPSPPRELTPEEIQLSWGPSQADWNYASAVAAAMTPQEAAGQVIVAHFDGRDPAELASYIARYSLGGVIFMSPNISDTRTTTQLTEAALTAGDGIGRTWPTMVSVDQEGGVVARLGALVQEMPAFLAAGAARDKTEVADAYAGLGSDMNTLGFNVNFAPVADVTIGLADPTIRTRSAGADPDNVGDTVVAAVDGFLEAGVIPTVKHFPGHGSVESDSHATLPIQTRTIAQLEARDLIPFQDAIDAGAPMIMMSHVQVNQWGSGPSTLNPVPYTYLREEMGFEGVIITDALNMAAVTNSHGPADAARRALNAGADLILMPTDVAAAHRGIVDAVASGALDRERLNQAAARSIALMLWQARLDAAATAAPDDPDDDGHYAKNLTLAGSTLVAPLCGQNYVGSSVRITGGWPSERDSLATAFAAHGVTVRNSGTHVHILGSPSGTANADIVVAMDGPWGLSSSNGTVKIGLYGRGTPSLEALAAVLVGDYASSGRWPVPVGSMPYDACPSPR